MRGKSISSVSVRTSEASGRARAHGRFGRATTTVAYLSGGQSARFLFGKTSARRVSANGVRTVRQPPGRRVSTVRSSVGLLLSRAAVIRGGGTTPRVSNNDTTSSPPVSEFRSFSDDIGRRIRSCHRCRRRRRAAATGARGRRVVVNRARQCQCVCGRPPP